MFLALKTAASLFKGSHMSVVRLYEPSEYTDLLEEHFMNDYLLDVLNFPSFFLLHLKVILLLQF